MVAWAARGFWETREAAGWRTSAGESVGQAPGRPLMGTLSSLPPENTEGLHFLVPSWLEGPCGQPWPVRPEQQGRGALGADALRRLAEASRALLPLRGDRCIPGGTARPRRPKPV